MNYLFPLAKRELSAFFHVVDQLFGAEQARQSALDWIDEMEAMSWPAGQAIPDWREATIRAAARLCSSRSFHLQQADPIDSRRKHGMNTEAGIAWLNGGWKEKLAIFEPVGSDKRSIELIGSELCIRRWVTASTGL